MNGKKLHLTLVNSNNDEIFSDFIAHIDAVDSHTVCYKKVNFSEADVIRLPYDITCWTVKNGIIEIYYNNGLTAIIIRK
jgi:hypothetical protein